jgi:hypothetical protein
MRPWVMVFAIVLVATGCGGGGGGSSSALATGSGPPAIVPSALSANIGLQRTLVQQGLTSTSQAGQIAQFAGGPASTLAVMRRAVAERRSTEGAAGCTNGVVDNSTFPSADVADVTIQSYYDTSCNTLWWVAQFVDTTSQTGGSTTGVGSYTYCTPAGTVYEYVNPATLSFGTASGAQYFSLGANIAANTSSSPYANVGLGCSLASATANCALADVQHSAALGFDQGEAVSVAAALTAGSTSTVVNLSGSGAGYTAPLNTLSITPQSFAGWNVTGGAPGVSVTLSGSVTLSEAGALAAEVLTITDSADGASLLMSYSAATQLITGTIIQTSSGQVAGTFSVSATGTGTVTYGNGATAQILNWVVEG